MSEMIERVARAIEQEIGPQDMDFAKIARAAVEAMREPTEAMLEVAQDMYEPVGDRAMWPPEPKDAWPAMIDAALTE